MTPRYLALLRGVNIGATRRVSMAELRVLFEGLGFRDVHTLLNSGNVIFFAPDHRRGDVLTHIESGLAKKLALNIRVVILSRAEVAAVVRTNPFSHAGINPSHLLVVVPRTRIEQRRLRPLLRQRWAPEALALGGRVAYVYCANGVARSPFGAAVDRALERKGTARNIATITKAATMLKATARYSAARQPRRGVA